MRTDLSPLYRATVGFDRVMNLLDSAARVDDATFSYPPYNIEKLDDDSYRIVMAVAGFSEADLEITVKEETLTVVGKKEKGESEAANFLHRGIATRAFERRFNLADHIRVVDASLANGLLSIDLVREIPEALKPRSIAIKAGAPTKVLESQAA